MRCGRGFDSHHLHQKPQNPRVATFGGGPRVLYNGHVTNYPYTVETIRSSRRTLAIQVMSPTRVVVRAPRTVSQRRIDAFVDERAGWIDAARTRIAARVAANGPAPTERELRDMRDRARDDLGERVAHWAPIVGASPRAVQIRNQKTRWGSCSTTGTISLNLQVMRLPEHIRDYVVVHELAHLIHHNHGPAFWAHVARCMPDYHARRVALRQVVLFS